MKEKGKGRLLRLSWDKNPKILPSSLIRGAKVEVFGQWRNPIVFVCTYHGCGMAIATGVG